MYPLIISSVLVMCDPPEDSQTSAIKIRSLEARKDCTLLEFQVTAKQWKRQSEFDRSVEVDVPVISKAVVDAGFIVVYLCESSRHVALPFTYYQVRRAMSFQPSYQKGKVYINILGHFIASPASGFTFKILVIEPELYMRHKCSNWNNYVEITRELGLPG